MKIIAEIERMVREAYCGAIGLNGQMDTNIAIRIVTIDDDLAVFHASSERRQRHPCQPDRCN
ncbi:anthranilate/para-aminobenzoate synthase component I [Bradyrhizobium sp. i1.8.4]|uniref:chorismate-binding protein n=1 Tax=unclassified Bradyrhizobium TaxID=2631580 RepID=UPI003D24FCF4